MDGIKVNTCKKLKKKSCRKATINVSIGGQMKIMIIWVNEDTVAPVFIYICTDNGLKKRQ